MLGRRNWSDPRTKALDQGAAQVTSLCRPGWNSRQVPSHDLGLGRAAPPELEIHRAKGAIGFTCRRLHCVSTIRALLSIQRGSLLPLGYRSSSVDNGARVALRDPDFYVRKHLDIIVYICIEENTALLTS